MKTDGSRKFLAAATLGIGLVVISLLAVRPPSALVFPSCPLHWATGFHCPGCGSLRATHFLLQGDWQAALQHNLLAVLMIPVLVWLLLGETVTAFGRRFPMRAQLSGNATWFLLAVILLFGVMRNLPAQPFASLAPPPAAAQQPDSPA
jgi:hypothetical protein